MIRHLLIPLVVLSLAGTLEAQSRDEPEQYDLKIHSQAPAEPALKDRLLPNFGEQTQGNAATVYLNACAWAEGVTPDKSLDEDALESATPEELNAAKAQSYVDAYREPIKECEIAGLRTDCVWGSTLREQGFNALLPYVNEARQIANALSIQTKLAIKQHRYDDAVRSLRTGMTWSRDLSREPIAVQTLVSVGIESLMLRDARYLMQSPGAPNLYWPLANVTPAYDQRIAMLQLERAVLFFTYPGLRQPERLTAQESRDIVNGIVKLAKTGQPDRELEVTIAMIGAYPRAKKYLEDRGASASEVEARPANSVVLAWYVAQYQRRSQAMDKWAGLPAWQALPGMAREKQGGIDDAASNDGSLLFVPSYLPTYQRTLMQYARVDRERGMAQVVEGIRAYAAGHDDALPKSLSDLSPNTPAPIDALLGTPFDYSVKGNVATLRAAAPAGEYRSAEIIYHITLVR
jgi:hypothetical protein